MGATLTTTLSRPPIVVDLTLDTDPALPPSPKFAYSTTKASSHPRSSSETETPPPKRQRRDGSQSFLTLGHSTSMTKSRRCLVEQVIPAIQQAISHLPRSQYRVNKLGSDLTADIAKSTYFKLRVDQTGGNLTRVDMRTLMAPIVDKIRRYEKDPKNIIKKSRTPSVPQSVRPSQPSPANPTVRPKTTVNPISTPPYRDVKIPKRSQRQERLDRPFKPLPARKPPALAQTDNLSYQLKDRRPYCSFQQRQHIADGLRRLSKFSEGTFDVPTVYHVDFSPREVADIVSQVCKRLGQTFPHTREGLLCLIRCGHELQIPSWISAYPPGRTAEDIRLFCSDLLNGRESLSLGCTSNTVLSLQRCQPRESRFSPRHEVITARTPALLLARELEGNTGYGRTRRHVNFQKALSRMREDCLDLIAQYTGCPGDVNTFAWVSNDAFVCGSTTHSDGHNQQYNKIGNLLLCSTIDGSLKAYPDHRVERPLGQGVNASHTMHRSQDSWIYPSVVASDYDPILKLAYTASFDKTVKVWTVDAKGRYMECLATWHHDAIVHFVKCAKDGSGLVATASNCVNKPAVRIYNVDPDNMPLTPDQELSCLRTDHLADDGSKWAYYPATMQWARDMRAAHLLAVGYSPRAESGDEHDIPEDKRQTGEIILWDARARKRIELSNASAANVFEIVWHPTLPRFACATSRCGTFKPGTRTQIHIFKQDQDRADAYFSATSLDCPALDINELTYMPNSLEHAYVTAACTDGRVYVWDTAFDSDLRYILAHGESLEIFDEERRELDDTGVKFTVWGSTLDRFYTGGSDGVVNVWNLQSQEGQNPFIRKLLPKAQAPIAGGAFSPDLQKLAIGDASGWVHLFSVDRRDECDSHYQLDARRPELGRQRKPVPMIKHPDPPRPRHDNLADMDIDEIKDSIDADSELQLSGISEDDEVEEARAAAMYSKTLLNSQQLVYSGQRTIGMVQGPNYHASRMFRTEAHMNNDPEQPLTWEHQKIQQWHVRANSGPRRFSIVRTIEPNQITRGLRDLHLKHQDRDSAILEVLKNSRDSPVSGETFRRAVDLDGYYLE